jgi:hypothetical protein
LLTGQPEPGHLVHAFIQNIRRGRYEPGLDAPRELRVAAASAKIAGAI